MNILKTRVILLFIVFCGISVSSRASDLPNSYEIKSIREQVLVSFHSLMDMWREELYFDMYGLGLSDDKKIISKVEFAQRMVDLYWKPSLKPEIIENAIVDYRTLVEIHAVIEFEHKVNPGRRIKRRMFFLGILENNKWNFSLRQLIKAPFSGKPYSEPPKKTNTDKKQNDNPKPKKEEKPAPIPPK
ncbi:MAG: hypothetical protein OEY59_04105 [Deltaproteobacteria bacterium]|nr:hypothetical protein [Deltaproteobacteria bacterium]